MTKLLLQSFFFLSITLLTFSSCGDDDEVSVQDLSGTYVGTKIELKNCDNSEDNLSYSGNKTDGICFEEDGAQGCIEIEITFTNGGYIATYTIDVAGFVITTTDTGTYDPESGANEICIDGDCGTIEIKDGGDKLVFSGQDDDTGCDATFELEKR